MGRIIKEQVYGEWIYSMNQLGIAIEQDVRGVELLGLLCFGVIIHKWPSFLYKLITSLKSSRSTSQTDGTWLCMLNFYWLFFTDSNDFKEGLVSTKVSQYDFYPQTTNLQ